MVRRMLGRALELLALSTPLDLEGRIAHCRNRRRGRKLRRARLPVLGPFSEERAQL